MLNKRIYPRGSNSVSLTDLCVKFDVNRFLPAARDLHVGDSVYTFEFLYYFLVGYAAKPVYISLSAYLQVHKSICHLLGVDSDNINEVVGGKA